MMRKTESLRKKGSILIILLLITALIGCSSTQNNGTAGNSSSGGAGNADPSGSPSTGTSGSQSAEDDWPNGPITIIAPVPPGGGVDIMSRGIASHLPKYLGVPVIVENIGGGLNIPGHMEFLNRPDDGSTLIATWQTVLSDRYLNRGAEFTIDDFALINIHQVDPVSIIVHKDAPWNTLEELINDIKNRPGQVPIGVLSGASSEVAARYFLDVLGLEARIVSFDGGNPFRLAVVGKDVEVGFGHAIGDHNFKDDLRMLAIYQTEPFEMWPEAPLINDVLKPFNVEVLADLASVRMLAAHSSFKEKYPDRWEKLVNAYQKMMEDEGYQAYLESVGESSSTRWMGPEESLRITLEIDALVRMYSGQN